MNLEKKINVKNIVTTSLAVIAIAGMAAITTYLCCEIGKYFYDNKAPSVENIVYKNSF